MTKRTFNDTRKRMTHTTDAWSHINKRLTKINLIIKLIRRPLFWSHLDTIILEKESYDTSCFIKNDNCKIFNNCNSSKNYNKKELSTDIDCYDNICNTNSNMPH